MYFLDTNICIYLLNNRHPSVRQKLSSLSTQDVFLSSIVAAELNFGACNSTMRTANLARLSAFLASFSILPFGENEAEVYGEIRTQLRQHGRPIGHADTLIAAHALGQNFVLVTNNVKQFQNVADLKTENWVE